VSRPNCPTTTDAPPVVVADDVGRAVAEAAEGYDTVCVGFSEHDDAHLPVGPVTEQVTREVSGIVALVRGSTPAGDAATRTDR
jgi:hypothetical protein